MANNVKITITLVGGTTVTIEDDVPLIKVEFDIVMNDIMASMPGSVFYMDNDDVAGNWDNGEGSHVRRWTQLFNGEYITHAKIEEM